MDGLYDIVGRRIHYLRVAVTDRCNFRCQYCMPSDGVKWTEHDNILRYEELLRIIHAFTSLGIDKVRITGGEPLVRKGLIPFLKKVTAIAGIKEVVLTTNGSMLEEYAPLLKKAGVKRVNVSLDTLYPERFKKITGQDALHQVLAGIKKAQAVGLTPIKINMVVMKDFNSDELVDFANLAMENPYQIRFIEYMPFCSDKNYLFTAAEIKQQLITAGFTTMLPEVSNNSPAQVYRFPQSQGSIGFITPVSQHFCSSCNRIRLTPDGNLKPCLLSNQEYSLRDVLRAGISDQELLDTIRQVVWNKPMEHELKKGKKSERGMYRIGG
ncbi:GTP 3',8-cyclase MoaA [Pelosinus sp. IPA-1]|uniref:GTP 3',8-cyclase MoaA n=1 Tax=Pelosinus sp. IPA-1 TaxID=3029569 RepID=UPI00243629C1|nr:GTP 3',8-cyclase MoaA [Pelosinus sp. IPA-1]GMB00295.1 GTP 3',8-cyclase MoaA [Pelosinus sp. IPA-1]